MYYQNYEDYMRSVLGYNNGENYSTYDNGYYPREMQTQDLEDMDDMYPDIYRIVYPVVCKVCDKNMNSPITHNTVDEMVEEVYGIVEGENEVKVETNKVELKNGDVRNPNVKQKEETRQRNFLLNDLIRILLLRELLRRRPRRPGRPGFPGRPPFPIGPGMPPQGPGGSRPPMMPRDLYY